MRRSRTWRAGRYVKVIAYDSVRKNDCPQARREKKNHSSKAQQELNARNSRAKLTAIIAEHFMDSPTALYLTLTFDPDNYPEFDRESQYRSWCIKEMKNYIKRLQYWAKKRGALLKAVYWPDVGDENDRWHFHMLVEGISPEDAHAVWGKGNFDFHHLYADTKWVTDREWFTKKKNVNPVAIAKYAMGNASHRKLGQHCWFHTRSCTVPKPDASVVIRCEQSIEPQDGCEILNQERIETMYSSYIMYEYILPLQNKPRRKNKRVKSL